MKIDADTSALLVVDVQERLMPAMDRAERVIGNVAVLLRAAHRLGVPMLASEQYPKGLGPTVAALGNLVPRDRVLAKTTFSVMADAALRDGVGTMGRRDVIVAGVEAHVCVMQTALDLARAGYAPRVVADATTSRAPESRDIALRRLEAHGVDLVTTEMVLFEWLGRAGTEDFRELSPLIR